jgi:prepilin-type N-terminal cleavage/methylation domain-containing protein
LRFEKHTNNIMLKSNFKYFINNYRKNRGFSLLELMVVLVIIGILAIGVVFMFADPTAKIKAVSFELRGDIHLARSVAVTENKEVRIDFFPNTDSYRIWTDDWDAGTSTVDTPPQDGVYTEDDPATPAKDGDTLVKEVIFRENVEYYEFAGAPPANGPAADPLGTTLTAGNGITLGATTLTLFPDGTCDNSGSIVVYYSPRDDFDYIKGDPYAVVVENTVTGRIIIQRWRRADGAWNRK